VRLAVDPNYPSLQFAQVWWQGRWQHIGGPHWSDAVAKVVCLQLGFQHGRSVGTYPGDLLRDYNCTGAELDLASCTFEGELYANSGAVNCSATDPGESWSPNSRHA